MQCIICFLNYLYAESLMFMNWFCCANNMFTTFFGWECLGLFSFFLISYWFVRFNTIKCAFRSLLVGKCGDVSFLSNINWSLWTINVLSNIFHIRFSRCAMILSRSIIGSLQQIHTIWFAYMIARCYGGSYTSIVVDSCINSSHHWYNSNWYSLILYRSLVLFFYLCSFLNIYNYILYRMIDNVTNGYKKNCGVLYDISNSVFYVRSFYNWLHFRILFILLSYVL